MEILVYRKGVPKIQEGFTADRPAGAVEGPVSRDLGRHGISRPRPTNECCSTSFKFHPLTVEDCRENRHYPKIEEFDGLYLLHRARRDAPTPAPIVSTRSSWMDFSVPTTSSLITTTCFAASTT